MYILEVLPGQVSLSLTAEDCEDLAWSLQVVLDEVVEVDESGMIQWAEAARCVFELCARLGRVMMGE